MLTTNVICIGHLRSYSTALPPNYLLQNEIVNVAYLELSFHHHLHYQIYLPCLFSFSYLWKLSLPHQILTQLQIYLPFLSSFSFPCRRLWWRKLILSHKKIWHSQYFISLRASATIMGWHIGETVLILVWWLLATQKLSGLYLSEAYFCLENKFIG